MTRVILSTGHPYSDTERVWHLVARGLSHTEPVIAMTPWTAFFNINRLCTTGWGIPEEKDTRARMLRAGDTLKASGDICSVFAVAIFGEFQARARPGRCCRRNR